MKAFVGQDPYWALLKMQVLRDYDRREDEEVMLFGGVPSNVKASAKGLWKLTRAHTEGIWLPLDAPHLFRNGGWIRDQLVSYTLISKKRLPNMKDEEFFRMTHLFLRGGH